MSQRAGEKRTGNGDAALGGGRGGSVENTLSPPYGPVISAHE